MKFKPPEASSVPSFVENLSAEIKPGPNGRSAVEFAATIHAKFVSVHPFVDGNGRCGRLLMNCILLTHGLPVVLVNYEDRARYLDTLEEANRTGDISSFVNFIIECFRMSVKDLGGFEEEELASPTESREKSEEEESTLELDPIDKVMTEEESTLELDPIDKVMIGIIQAEHEAIQTTYDSLVKGFALLASEINSVVEGFNQKYEEYGSSMFFKNYDMISLEKYVALSKNQKASRTWFCLFGINHGPLTEKLLCFFQKPSFELQREVKNARVSLALARHNGEAYVRLVNEPVKVREVCYSDGQIVFLCADGSIIQGNISYTIKEMVADLIKNYIKGS